MKLWSVKVEQYLRGASPGAGLWSSEDYIVAAADVRLAAKKALSEFRRNGAGNKNICRKPEITKIQLRDEVFAK